MDEFETRARGVDAVEVPAEDLEDLFELETLVPPTEANPTSCCVIICRSAVMSPP